MEDKINILIVEDEQTIRSALADFLDYHNFITTQATSGTEAKQIAAQKRFDLILLDLMLPGISGEELCSLWRKEGLQTPIIMVTAKGQEKDKIQGLDIGADDYITKPFSLEEMLARIKAVLRRTDPARSVGHSFMLSDLEIDVAALKAKRGEKEIQLTSREAAIVQYFAANPNRIISRDDLYRDVWNETLTGIETRTIDMHIAKLRNKIEIDTTNPQIIKTVRGAGYKYES